MRFYKNFCKHLHVVELLSGALLLFIGFLIFFKQADLALGKTHILESLLDVRFL